MPFSLPFVKLRMHGSKVHLYFIYFSFFRSASEKTKNRKKEKYRCENHTWATA